jgi:GNAT superfamily N-acetyltransferase
MDNSIQFSTDKSKLDIELIHDYLSNKSYWAKGRSIETIKRSIEHSLCFGVYDGKAQVGFARVVTDYAVFAWVMDVFILEAYKKIGLGKKLMHYLTHYKELQGLQRWGLGTDDAHGLYAKFGFTPLKMPGNMMEKLGGKHHSADS